MKRAVFHPEAGREYLESVEYYARYGPELAFRFDSEIQELVAEACRNPLRFYQFHPPLRRALSRKFPYSLVYLEQPDRIWIVAVMHGNRSPGYWLGRLS